MCKIYLTAVNPIVTNEHDPEGFQRSAVFPITRALREHIENAVLEKYQAAIA